MDAGKLFIIAGGLMLVFGLVYSMGFRGLPGDIVVQKKNAVFVFPIATSIVISFLITLVLLALRR